MFPIMVYIQTVIFTIVIFSCIDEGVGLRKAPPLINRHPKMPLTKYPEIWMSEYSEDDSYFSTTAEKEFRTQSIFQSDLAIKNGSTYTLLDTTTVIFTCQAKYPVKWSAPNHSQLPLLTPYSISSVQIRVSSSEQNTLKNKYFKSILVLYPLINEFFSVTFSCTSTNKGKYPLESTIHVYLAGTHVMERQGQTITVPISMNNAEHDVKSVLLPCRPAIPNTQITLEKQFIIRKSEIWKPVPSKYFTFDPRTGFTLQKFSLAKKILGSYRCVVNGSSVDDDKDIFVYLNLTAATKKDEDTSLSQLEPHLIIKGNAGISLNTTVPHSSSVEIRCCSGDPKSTPKFIIRSCENELNCEVTKVLIDRSIKGETNQHYIDDVGYEDVNNGKDCRKHYLFGNPVFAHCHADNIDFFEEYVSVFNPNAKNYTPNENDTSLHSLKIYKSLADIKKSGINERILMFVGYGSTLEKENSKGNYYRAILYSKDYVNSDTYLRKESEENYRILENVTVEYDRNFYYEGEPLLFACFGLRYFYSFGAQMIVNWKNGSKTVVESKSVSEGYTNYVQFHPKMDLPESGTDLVSVFGKELTAEKGMESVDCFMPYSSNSLWDTLTYNLSIAQSYPPKFSGSENAEDIIYFRLNDTEKEITWKIVGGLPRPTVNVTKDEKELSTSPFFETDLKQYHENSSVNTIKVTFKRVTYEAHGVYKCEAENVRGKIVKTIKVIVTESKSSSAGSVAFICFFTLLLSIVMVIVGIKYRLQLKLMLKM